MDPGPDGNVGGLAPEGNHLFLPPGLSPTEARERTGCFSVGG